MHNRRYQNDQHLQIRSQAPHASKSTSMGKLLFLRIKEKNHVCAKRQRKRNGERRKTKKKKYFSFPFGSGPLTQIIMVGKRRNWENVIDVVIIEITVKCLNDGDENAIG